MGTFNVELQIGAADFSAWETVSALVDTGATYSMAPAGLLRRLGIESAQITELSWPAAKSSLTKRGGPHSR